MSTLEKMILDRFKAVQLILDLKRNEWPIYQEANYNKESDTNYFYMSKCIEATVALDNAIKFAEKCLGMIDGGKEDEHESNCR